MSDPATTPPADAERIVEAPLQLDNKIPTITDLLPEQVKPYWELVQQYPLIEAVLIIALFWIAAYLIRRYAISLIGRLAGHTDTDLDDQIIYQIRGPVFATVIWLGVIIASVSAGFTEGIFRYLTPVIMSLIILAWLRASLEISGRVFKALSSDRSRFKKIDVRTEPLLIITSKILILLIGAYILLSVWGINPVGLLASAGIVGIAFGFAAKDTLANLFSGVFILADQPYALGDYVNLESGERGKVTHIGIRSTRILTRDDIEITIPNGVIGNAKVINESGGPHKKMRIRMSLQCAYEADLDEVENVLMKLAEEHEQICRYPAPRVRVRGFGESGINLQLLCWVEEPEDRGRMTHVMYSAIHRAFREHELEIPYPKRDVTVSNAPDSGGE